MKSTLKREMKLKSGKVFAKGEDFIISIIPEKPMIAEMVHESMTFKVRSAKLWKYFPEFINPAKEIGGEDFDSSVSVSLIGKRVEPDGWDEHGFPSVLLAIGWI